MIDLCHFPGCDRERKYRRWCGPHYKQERGGKPMALLRNRGGSWSLEDLLLRTTAYEDCLLWTKGQGKYGDVWHDGSCWKVHRLVYFLHTGECPEEGTVHHICANTRCINPDHLERASRTDNVLEMLSRKDYEARIAALEARVKELEAQLDNERREVIM